MDQEQSRLHIIGIVFSVYVDLDVHGESLQGFTNISNLERMTKALVAWSSGKDSAWALHCLLRTTGVQIVGLLTTFNQTFDRVAMHAVRRDLVDAQAESVGLPLRAVPL